MSKVLFVYERNMPTVSLMQSTFQRLFVGLDIEMSFLLLSKVSPQIIDCTDVLVLVRPDNLMSLYLAKCAHKVGCYVITFCDDDLLNLPDSMPTMPWRKRALIGVLGYSHMVLSSSQYIGEKYKKYTKEKRFAIVNTIVSEDEVNAILPIEERNHQRVKIVYAAATSHKALFDEYIKPIMLSLCERFADRITIDFVGVHPDIEEFEKKMDIHYKESMPLHEYRAYMRSQQYDIGLAPLKDDEFSKCKYFNKFLEYTLVGTTGIYTKCEPYTYVVKDKYNGFLSNNNSNDWLEALSLAIEDCELRKQCLINARDLLISRFNADSIRNQVIGDVPEFLQTRMHKEKCGLFFGAHVRYRLQRLADWVYLLYFYLKKAGINGVTQKAKDHIKDSKAYR